MKRIKLELTEDQAYAVITVLDYGKSDPIERWSEKAHRFVRSRDKEEVAYDNFLTRIQNKIRKQLRDS